MSDKQELDTLQRWEALAKRAVACAVQENKDLGLAPSDRRTEWVEGVLCHIEGDKVSPVLSGSKRRVSDDEPATLIIKF